nr:5'-nucleotidase C-terminal domain-containing protein [uncultured Holophaga sp.]
MLRSALLPLLLLLLPFRAQGQDLAMPVTASAGEDPAVAAALAPNARIIQEEFGQILAQAPRAIPRSRQGITNLAGFWVTGLMRLQAARSLGQPVPLAMTNNGGIRAAIHPGPVRVADLYELMPFDNELVVAEYSGTEIRGLVVEALQKRGGEPWSGLRVHLGGSPEHPVLAIALEDGTPLEPDARYQVATSDFLVDSGDGLPTRRPRTRVRLTGVLIRDVLLEACRSLGSRGESLTAPEATGFSFDPGMREALLERRIAW